MDNSSLKPRPKEFKGCFNTRHTISLSIPRDHGHTAQSNESASKSSHPATEKRLKLNPLKNRAASPTPSVFSEKSYYSI